jgi:hypothetical protein
MVRWEAINCLLFVLSVAGWQGLPLGFKMFFYVNPSSSFSPVISILRRLYAQLTGKMQDDEKLGLEIGLSIVGTLVVIYFCCLKKKKRPHWSHYAHCPVLPEDAARVIAVDMMTSA